jgi:hypothetical protein
LLRVSAVEVWKVSPSNHDSGPAAEWRERS